MNLFCLGGFDVFRIHISRDVQVVPRPMEPHGIKAVKDFHAVLSLKPWLLPVSAKHASPRRNLTKKVLLLTLQVMRHAHSANFATFHPKIFDWKLVIKNRFTERTYFLVATILKSLLKLGPQIHCNMCELECILNCSCVVYDMC